VGYSNLAFIFLQSKEYDKAIEYARRALEIYPGFGDAYLNMARGYAGKGMLEEARRAYAQAKAANPQLREAVDDELKSLDGTRRAK
jgi:tetratricopeptide (TPR) repeat protein